MEVRATRTAIRVVHSAQNLSTGRTLIAWAISVPAAFRQSVVFGGDPVREQARSFIPEIQLELTALRDDRRTRRRWLTAAAAVVAATLMLLAVRDVLGIIDRFDVVDVTLIYLLVCFAVSLTLGTGPAMLAALLSFIANGFFFIPPYYDLRVERSDEGLILLVFLVVALVGARLMTEIQTRTTEAERLLELDRLRGAFVDAISHDLQTPLTAIRAGLGLLEASASDQLRPDEAQLLTNARRNVDRLSLQIADLLSLNQLEADQFPMSVAPFDLRTVIASAVAVTHPLTEQKGQVLEVAVEHALPVEGDARHLEHALVNLVANAHRHTPSGTRITIDGKATAKGVVLQVADTGPGIPAHARKHLFDRFYRADAASGGSGLGLSIAREIVERHDGRLWIVSEPGQGATFSILLPHPKAKE